MKLKFYHITLLTLITSLYWLSCSPLAFICTSVSLLAWHGMAWHGMISTDSTVLSENYHLQIKCALLNKSHVKLLPKRGLVLHCREFVHLKECKS